MIDIKKVRGKEELKPIRMSQSEYKYLISKGEDPTKFINKLVEQTAKKRKWAWWFAKQALKP
jgi:hypothetical protein